MRIMPEALSGVKANRKVRIRATKYYALIYDHDRKISSSGGAFSVFAKWIIAQGGIVYGATINEKFEVMHIGVESAEELSKLRGSKYVQSIIGDTYKEIRNHLRSNRKVLFVGTGCQVGGLYAFLNGKRYEGMLYTLDLVCHGTPSYGAFKSYLSKLEKSTRLTASLGILRDLDFANLTAGR